MGNASRLGRYELLLALARGGMAELFLGRLHGAGGFAKLVAIKRILPHLVQDPQFKEMFLEEGRIASHLSHPNVCQVFELDEADGELFLAMEYLDGVSWDHLRAAATPGVQMQQLVAGVLAQAAEGLHYAHTLRDVEGRPAPVVHRDISPQNLFVTVDGICKVLDFGVAKMQREGSQTRSGVLKGKLPYMAPEQIRGEPLDGRADVFALGVCAWEALACRRLYDRPSDYQIWKAITEEPVPPIDPSLCPPALDAVVRRALARDREYRQPTARAFADELRATIAGGGASPGQIADAVRTLCGDRISERARQVATVVSARRSASEIDPAGSDTLIEEPGSTAELPRATTGNVEREIVERDPGSTVRARPERSRDPAPFAAPPPVGAPPPAVSQPPLAAPPPRQATRTKWPVFLGLGVLAMLVTIVVVVAVQNDGTAANAAVIATPDAAEVPDVTTTMGNAAVALEKARHDVSKAMGDVEKAAKHLEAIGSAARALRDNREPEPVSWDEPERGMLTIDSQPPVTIFVGDEKIGDTPLVKREVPAGRVIVRAVLPDGREQSKVVTIEVGKDLDMGTLVWP